MQWGRSDANRAALDTRSRCPVKADCLATAMRFEPANGITYRSGIWGGTTRRSAPPWPHDWRPTDEPTTQGHRHRCRDGCPPLPWSTTAGPDCERRALAGNRDTGDLTVCRRPLIVAEVKAGHAADKASPKVIADWLEQTDTEAVHAGAVLGVLIVARKYRNPATGTPGCAPATGCCCSPATRCCPPMRRGRCG